MNDVGSVADKLLVLSASRRYTVARRAIGRATVWCAICASSRAHRLPQWCT